MSRFPVARLIARSLPIFALVASLPALAETPEALFARANETWFAGRYDEACGLYGEALEGTGRLSPPLVFNLGNCRYREGKLGEAVWHFAMAARSDDPQISNRAGRNLGITKKALLEKNKKKIEKGILLYDESHGITYALFTLVNGTVLLVTFLVLSAALFTALFLWTFARNARVATIGRILLLSVAAPALLAAVLYFGQAAVERTYHFGIVTSQEARLLDAPSEDAPFRPLPEGLEVRILLHNENGFFKLQMSDGRTGYAADGDVRPLDPPDAD
jgi:tetratricopeptide (TPR) repeat protein